MTSQGESQLEKNFKYAIPVRKHKKILEMLRAGCSLRETARAVRVGMNTVQRRKLLLEIEYRKNNLAIAREISLEDGCEAVAFEDVRGERRCPVHGAVTVWPCVACTILAVESPGKN